MVRTRFAPSPTGFMHLGNLRTALYGFLFTRSQQGTFILRIEDTDQERKVEGAEAVIYETLAASGIAYDEGPDKDGGYGPYVQSQRKHTYLPYAKELVEKGLAYPCFCTEGEIAKERARCEEEGKVYKYDKRCQHISKEEAAKRMETEGYVIRLNTPLTGKTGFQDEVFGYIEVENETLDDMVLIKSDGMPTYNFANVIDDHLMAITHVFRGSEYLSSTPKYNLLYNAFGWETPRYVHLPLIMKNANQKLSKRHGDAYFSDFTARGFLPEAIINYIALLGWNPGDNRELFTVPELIEAFSLSHINKSPALFDEQKMMWLNGEHIKRLPAPDFAALAAPWYEKAQVSGYAESLNVLLQPRIQLFGEIPGLVSWLEKVAPHETQLYCLPKFKITPQMALDTLRLVKEALAGCPWRGPALHDALLNVAKENGYKNGQVLWPARVALSGLPATPGGAAELAEVLGKEETLSRLEAACKMLGAAL